MHNHRAAIFSRREFLSQNGDIFQICLYDLVRGGDVNLNWMTGSSLTVRQTRVIEPKCVALYKQIYFLFLFYIKLFKPLKLFLFFYLLLCSLIRNFRYVSLRATYSRSTKQIKMKFYLLLCSLIRNFTPAKIQKEIHNGKDFLGRKI